MLTRQCSTPQRETKPCCSSGIRWLEPGHMHASRPLLQNLDDFRDAGGSMLGTDIVRRLVVAGFAGVLFIRSGNDTVDDVANYRKAGATDVLAKNNDVDSLAMEVLVKYNQARSQ